MSLQLEDVLYKSEQYFTKADKANRTRYIHKMNALVREMVTLDKTSSENESVKADKKKALQVKYNDYNDRIQAIEGQAQLRYIEDVNGDYDRILADAKDILDQITYSGFFIDYSVIMPLEAGKEFEFEKQFIKQTAYIFSVYCDEQTAAAERYDLYNRFIKDMQPLFEAKALKFLNEDIGGTDKLIALREQVLNDRFRTRSEVKQDKAGTLTNFATPPEKFFTPNSYVAAAFPLWAKKYYEGQIEFGIEQQTDISGKKSEDNIPVYYSLSLDTDLVDEETGKQIISYDKGRIKGFDLAVHDAICSFLEAGQNTLYISAIDRFMSGGKKVNISNTRTQRILSALRKLSGTRLYLNASNDTRLKEHDIKELVYDEAMITYTGLELTTYAGQKTYVFNVEKLPPMYRYSKTKGEIVSFATNLLNTGDRAEERTTPLKIQLLKRITLINKGQMSQTSISYDYIYSRADTEQPQTRQQWQRDKDRFKGWLKFWQDIGYIKGFSVDNKGITIKPNYIAPQKRYDNKPVIE